MMLVLAVVGPTAVGKSSLALKLAQRFRGEVINADSRQVYRLMDIGTAKPSLKERSLVHHHLFDILDPDESFNVAAYRNLANQAIQDIHERGNVPILAGGTGMYVWSVLEGWSIPPVPPDADLRKQLEGRAAREGSDKLHRELEQIDPAAAARIHPHNVRRVIRALEVHQRTGELPSQIQSKRSPAFESLIIGLTVPRRRLHNLIDERVDDMIEHGLVDEVRTLLDRGYGLHLPSMSSVGHREIGEYLQGRLALSEAVQQIKYETHRLAIHQYAWFRLSDPRIHWYDVEADGFEEEAAHLVRTMANE